MSPSRIAEGLQRFIDAESKTAPWEELRKLYHRVERANERVDRAFANERDRFALDAATAAARRARRDLLHAMRPIERLDPWSKDYLAAWNHLRPDDRLGAIERLKASLHADARAHARDTVPRLPDGESEADPLAGLVLEILGDCEREMPMKHEKATVPARRFGLGEKLRHWFARRSRAVVRAAEDESRAGDELALVNFAFEKDIEGASLFAALAQSRLTEAQREIVRLRAEGLSDSEIAHKLGLSPTTVRVHAAAAAERLQKFAGRGAGRPPHKSR